MSLERRVALVDIARRHGVAIIEDDVYGPLVSQRLPTIASLCPELTFHIAATSKVLAPGLRLGYLLSPPDNSALCAEAVRTTAWMPAPMSMLIASIWIEDGTAQHIMDAQLAEIRARQALARELLPQDLLQARSCLHVCLAEASSAVARRRFRRERKGARCRGDAVVRVCGGSLGNRARRADQPRLRKQRRDQLVSGLRMLASTLARIARGRCSAESEDAHAFYA